MLIFKLFTIIQIFIYETHIMIFSELFEHIVFIKLRQVFNTIISLDNLWGYVWIPLHKFEAFCYLFFIKQTTLDLRYF